MITATSLLGLVVQFGPAIIPLVGKLVGDIEAGKGNTAVTAADLAELTRLAGLTGASIYAGLGITPPPAAPVGDPAPKPTV